MNYDKIDGTIQTLGEPKIPFFMVINNAGKVLLTHSGPIKSVDKNAAPLLYYNPDKYRDQNKV